MADWKRMSHLLSYMAHKFGVGLSTPQAENGFQRLGKLAYIEVPGLGREFGKMTPKQLRAWLWEVRHDPVFKEQDVLIYVERQSPTSWRGSVGRAGSPDHEDAIVFTEVS
jgi:hypothetical protein